jgi:hypothetical protein
MSKAHIDLVYKANAIADDVCAPLLKSRDEAQCWLDIAQGRYEGAWNGAHAIALKSLKDAKA